MRIAIIPGDGDFVGDVLRAAIEGYTHLEIEGMAERPAAHLEALAESGLFVERVRLGWCSDAEDVGERRAALERQKRMIADAARLGATVALVCVGTEEEANAYSREGVELLTAFAAVRGMRLVMMEVTPE